MGIPFPVSARSPQRLTALKCDKISSPRPSILSRGLQQVSDHSSGVSDLLFMEAEKLSERVTIARSAQRLIKPLNNYISQFKNSNTVSVKIALCRQIHEFMERYHLSTEVSVPVEATESERNAAISTASDTNDIQKAKDAIKKRESADKALEQANKDPKAADDVLKQLTITDENAKAEEKEALDRIGVSHDFYLPDLTSIRDTLLNYAGEVTDIVAEQQLLLQKLMQALNQNTLLMNTVQSILSDFTRTVLQSMH